MSEQAGLRIIGDVEIAKLRLTAGDVLVVKADSKITKETADHIQMIIKEKLPPDVGCMVIDPSIILSVLTRAEIEAKAA